MNNSIKENIAYAKSVLSKNGISESSPEWTDYLKIREICGNDNGYVGVLTKIRFVDGVNDMDEIKSIYDVLKNSKFDLSKLNKLTYQQILDEFYDELSGSKDVKDYELFYKDPEYSYYKVYTYEGILEIGSPAWCLKTKSHWDNYQSKYQNQWVVINNKYVKKIISPNDNYLSGEYSSSTPWIRFGVSMKLENGVATWVCFSDNNREEPIDPCRYTSFGIIYTILNLSRNIKKSIYQSFPGCSNIPNIEYWLKVNNVNDFIDRILSKKWESNSNEEIYVCFNDEYAAPIVFMVLDDNYPTAFRIIKNGDTYLKLFTSGDISTKLINDYASRSKNELYFGIKLKLGKITEEEIQKSDKYIKTIGNWFVFNRNDNYYLIVNRNPPSRYTLKTKSLDKVADNPDNPIFWYLSKVGKNIFGHESRSEFAREVIKDLYK